jgi:hypothetical protein
MKVSGPRRHARLPWLAGERLAVLPGAGQSGASSLTQDPAFECCEDGQQPRLRSTRSRTADEYGQGCHDQFASRHLLPALLETCKQATNGKLPLRKYSLSNGWKIPAVLKSASTWAR